MATSSPAFCEAKALQSVYTVYAYDEASRQSRRLAPRPRLLASQLSFHEDFLAKQRLGRISAAFGGSGRLQCDELTDELLFELNRASSHYGDMLYFLSKLRCANCSELGLSSVGVSDAALYHFDALNVAGNRLTLFKLSALKCARLDLSDNALTDEIVSRDADSFAQLESASPLQQSLTDLDVGANFFSSLQGVFRLLACFPHLRALEMASSRFAPLPATLKADNCILAASHIHHLCLDSTPISAAQLQQIVLAAAELRSLSMNGCALKMQHFVAIARLQLLEALSARDNAEVSTKRQIFTVLCNVRFPALKRIDIARQDCKHNCRNDAVCTVSLDAQLRIFQGAVPGNQRIDIVLYERPQHLGLRIPLTERHMQLPSGAAQPQTAIAPRSALQILNGSKAPKGQARCASMLETVKPELISRGEYSEVGDQNPTERTAERARKRPQSNRKHILANDGLDYVASFLRDELCALQSNTLIADSIKEYLAQFREPQTRDELIMYASMHRYAEEMANPDDKMFVTELDPEASANQQAHDRAKSPEDVSLFDDKLLSRALFKNLDLVLGPTTEEELLNHPIDVSGLTGFLPRGTYSCTKDVYAALRLALETPLGDELRIDDEEILQAILAGAGENM